MAANADPAFKTAGKKVGLEVFRIEKLKVVQITDTTKFGKFFSGDSYIVLNTEKNNNALRWDIHFWLGKNTSQDEAGVAAYKTVELDDSLGGAAIQHRETEGAESQAFLSLFQPFGGVKYAEGGVESGFKKVNRDEYEKRLLQVKGKRNVRISPVEISYKSLNNGDVFILDCGLKIFQWNGKSSSKAERAKGLEVVRDIRDNERGGKAKVFILDEKDNDTDFFNELGGKGPIAETGEDDDQFEKKKAAQLKLYRVSDASGAMKIAEAGGAPLRKDMLDTKDSFILDTAQSIFVWIGKKSTKEEKAKAWDVANAFIKEKGYPKSVPVTRLSEGAETSIFIQQFEVWPSPQLSPNYVAKKGNVAKVEQKTVDYKAMYGLKKETQAAVDDGSGKLEIWRVEDFKKVPVDPKTYGQFYMGDSYVILYTYKDAQGKEHYIVYFWQGSDSTQDEKGASALLAKEIDDSLHGAAVQVRVVENKEPDHFLGLFKGKFIIHRGGRGSGFKSSKQGDNYDTDGTRLFQVHGSSPLNTKAVQVEEVAASLNSNDCFVLETRKATFVWYGKASNGDERAVAKSVAETISPPSKVENAFEGKEPADFWVGLGGKGEYVSPPVDPRTNFEPRLFQCSNASGRFTVEEIYDFAQEDLISDDIMLLDRYVEVYVWVGSGANESEKKDAIVTAAEYVKNAPDARNSDTPIIIVKQGFEPKLFTANFQAWSDEKAKANVINYNDLKAALAAGNDSVSVLTASTAEASLASKKVTEKFTYARLSERPLPDNVDVSQLENYLQDDEFPKVFGATFAEFMAWPKWKRDAKKKEKKLF